MDEIEVKVVKAKVFECFPTSCFHVLWVVFCVPKLASDENLRSGNTRGNDSCPNFRLIAIEGSTVKVPIALSKMEPTR